MADASPVEKIAVTACTEYTAYDHAASITDCNAIATVLAPPYKPQYRSPVDIVAVIDHSSSMAGEKLNLVKETLFFIIDKLSDCDQLGLVCYNETASVEFLLTPMTMQNKKLTKSQVKKIQASGFTNLCSGLLLGMKQITDRDEEQESYKKPAYVLLLTDGLPNRGVETAKEIIASMKDLTASLAKSKELHGYNSCLAHLHSMSQPKDVPKPMDDKGTIDFEGTVYTFGFGSDHDGDLLTTISDNGGGMYYYIESERNITKTFADCLGGLLSLVGQNITLTIEAQPHCTLGTVHYKIKPQLEPDRKTCVVFLGDLQSEEERHIIIPVNLEALEAECMAQPLIKVTLSYFDIITRSIQKANVNLAVDRKLIANLEPNEAVRTHLQRVQVTLALQKARQIIPVNPQHAMTVLEDSRRILETSEDTPLNTSLTRDIRNTITTLDLDMRTRHTVSSFQRSINRIANFGQQTSSQRRNDSLRYTSFQLDTSPRRLMRDESDNYSLTPTMK